MFPNFSYFMEILKVEGKLKVSDVTDLWEQVAQDFCNIKLVLPDLKGMVLLRSYICIHHCLYNFVNLTFDYSLF